MCLIETSCTRYCKPCCTTNPSLRPTLKPPARKSSRKRTQPDYANLHAGLDALSTDGTKWLRVIETKDIKPDAFRRLQGSEVNSDWLEQDPEALREPIVIESPEGLGMRMPDKDFTVADVAEVVGPQTPVEVIGGLTSYTKYTHLAHQPLFVQMCQRSPIPQIGILQSGPNTTHSPQHHATRSAMSSRSSFPIHRLLKWLVRRVSLRSLIGWRNSGRRIREAQDSIGPRCKCIA
jgi:hypothetical protein